MSEAAIAAGRLVVLICAVPGEGHDPEATCVALLPEGMTSRGRRGDAAAGHALWPRGSDGNRNGPCGPARARGSSCLEVRQDVRCGAPAGDGAIRARYGFAFGRRGTLPPVKRDTRLIALHAFIGEVTARPARRSAADHIACAHAVLSACGAARRLCWSAIGIDVDGLLGRIAARDPYVAMQLALQRAFGLGVAEVLPLRPHEADRGGYLAVRTETDTRRIPIDTPQQRATLDAAKRLAPYPGAALHAPGAPPCELIQRYHAECFAAGFALSGLRIQASAIRHEGALAEILAAAAQARVPCLDREVCRVDR